MRFNTELTAHQQQILVLLAQGNSINAAAEAVGIHRNTIANWRRSSESFRGHWHNMQYEQAMHWRDQLQSIAQIAVDAILKTLTDEKTPPGVRLRAALAVLDKVTTVAPAQPGLTLSTTQETALPTMHNLAQQAQPGPTAASVHAETSGVVFPEETKLHNSDAPAPSAQPCTTELDEFLESLRHLDDDGVADLLEHITTPPRLHNRAQATSPGGSQSGSSRPGSRDSS